MTTTLQSKKTTSQPSKYASATWYVVSGGADTYWRAEMPAKHVGAKLAKFDQGEANRVFFKPSRSKKFTWYPTKDGASYPKHEGVAVWTRPDIPRATHAAAMSALGHRVVAEVDDNYLSNPRQNYFMRQGNFRAEGRRAHMQAFASMDAIIFSTGKLRDQYAKAFKEELKHVPEMHVARNHVDLDDWTGIDKDWPGIRVGIMGSQQHLWDWRLAAPALHMAKSMGATLVFIGLDPAMFDPKWREFLGGYEHIPWVDPEEYHRRGLPLDIGLCPLVTNEHTMGKSDVKFLEYTMSGIATVAQNNVVYNRSIVHGETGLLAGSPDEMAFAVRDLIRDASLRERLVENATQYVREERTIQKNKHEWEDAIYGH